MFKCILTLAAVCFGFTSNAQKIAGSVKDAHTKELVPFAKVFIPAKDVGTIADENGRFVLVGEIPQGTEIIVSAAMYDHLTVFYSGEDSLDFILHPKHHEIGEILIYADPGVMNKTTTTRVDRLAMLDLRMQNPTSLVEAITNINGVQQLSAGLAGPKPIIRGMWGMRVVTLVEGMRLENQQWGADHGLSISQLGVGAVEVIKGPAGLQFAGDALGGVLYIDDQNYAPQNTWDMTINSSFESVNMGFTNSALYRVSKDRLRLSVGALSSTNGDYLMPNGQYLGASRFNDHGAKFNLGYGKGKWTTNVGYMYANQMIGIPGHTHDSIATQESFMRSERGRGIIYPHQAIQNHFININNTFTLKKHELSLRATHASNNLAEFDEKVFTPYLHMLLNVTSLRFKHRWKINNNHTLNSGVQSSYQTNNNVPGAESRLIDNSIQHDHGVYSSYMLQMGAFEFEAAARIDARWLDVSTGLSELYLTPNGSIGGAVKWFGAGEHVFRVNVSSGSRAPSVGELLADGQHHGAIRYELGDPTLRPERATQIDVDYEFSSEHVDFVVNPFYTYMQDYIQIQDFDSIIDGLPVFGYVGVDAAQMYGVDANIHYHPHFAHNLHLESGFSLVYGEEIGGMPLTFIPQARLNTRVQWLRKIKKKVGFEGGMIQYQYFLEQDRPGILEQNTPAFQLLNASVSFRWDRANAPVYLTVGARNILNESYVPHVSRLRILDLMEPARSIFVSLRIHLGKSEMRSVVMETEHHSH